MVPSSKQKRWTGDWRGFLVGAAVGVVFAVVLAAAYYFALIRLAPHLVYQARTHVLGWLFCQSVLVLSARRMYERYPVVVLAGALTGIVALALAFFELSFLSQVGI